MKKALDCFVFEPQQKLDFRNDLADHLPCRSVIQVWKHRYEKTKGSLGGDRV